MGAVTGKVSMNVQKVKIMEMNELIEIPELEEFTLFEVILDSDTLIDIDYGNYYND